MLKLVFIGVWVAGLTTGATMYFAENTRFNSLGSEAGLRNQNLEHMKIDLMNIAMIQNSKIAGYILIEPIIIVDSVLLAQMTIPIDYFARDAIINILHSKDYIDIYRLEKFDLESFQKHIAENINARIGSPIVDSILIQSIDFITKEDVRDLQLRRS